MTPLQSETSKHTSGAALLSLRWRKGLSSLRPKYRSDPRCSTEKNGGYLDLSDPVHFPWRVQRKIDQFGKNQFHDLR